MATKQPNLLFIQADQLKPQVLPMYGGPALTPNLSRLADSGVTFDNALGHAGQQDRRLR